MSTPPSTPHAHPATAAVLSLPVHGMSCASCVGRVEKAVRQVPGVAEVSVNLATERIHIQPAGPLDTAAVVQAIEKAGYEVPSQTVELAVEGMTCASCVGRVERALQKVPGVTAAQVNLATERATVQGSATLEALLAALDKAGYPGQPIDTQAARAQAEAQAAHKEAEYAALQRDFTLATVLALPVFVLEMGSHLLPGMHHWVAGTIGLQNSWYLQCVLTALVLLIPGRRFYTKGLPALLRGGPDMNSLVAVGTLAAFSYSVVATFLPGLLPAGTVNVYFEAAAVIVALILLGRMLEARAKGRTSQAIQRLIG
ncbi:MAG TPA: heavy metal translocating P-type ATPase, partial [Comamonas kerstersii]|nr:heavy metal translocating P-type ATPase [Comamonas kerstersii]